MTTIVGIDPGETTGVCALETPRNGHVFQVVGVYQIPWEDRVSFFRALFTGGIAQPDGYQLLPEIVAIESFRLRPGRAMEQVGSEFPSVRVIGIVEAFLSLCSPQPLLAFQEPVIIGRCQILSEHEQLFRGLVHAGDAYRHARYYYVMHWRP